jgi:hypothetical protein
MSWAIVGMLALAAAAQDPTGSLAGTVIDAATRQPVKHAMVNLYNREGPRPGDPGHATSTDASGAFSFDGLAEGAYLVNATHSNYPPGGARPTTLVEVKAGEKNGSIVVELKPGAVVTGHIVDEDGDPLTGCLVRAYPAGHLAVPRSEEYVHEDGGFRMRALPSGMYVFWAYCGAPAFVPRPLSIGPGPPPSLGYPPQFFPLGNDPKSAQAVDLAPGVEKPGIDFRMRPVPVTQVRGGLSLAGGGSRPAGNLNLQLFPVNRPWQPPIGVSRFNDDQSGFEFDQVLAGSYYIVALLNSGDFSIWLTAVERIEVKDRPLEVPLALKPGVDVTGSITVEDPGSNHKIALTDVYVQLLPDPSLHVGTESRAQVKEDGSFLIQSVAPARWKVDIFGPQIYLKSARLGGTDVTHASFGISTGADPLRIVVSTALGAITGTAPAGGTVFAAADDTRLGPRTVQIDQGGRFTLPQIPPGKYRVGVTDPGVQIPDDGGQEVTVHEGETLTVDLKPPAGVH